MAGALRLRSPSGELEATFEPARGMLGTSLRWRGREVLGRQGGDVDPVLRAAMVGIPLLHPWANRLSRPHYVFAGREASVPDAPFVPRDGFGRPIHGLVAAPDAWRATLDRDDRMRAWMEFPTDPERGRAFPFPHRMVLDVVIRDDALTVAATLEPTGDVAVPVAFGFHPYLRLPGGRRDEWRVAMPALRQVELTPEGLPTGATTPHPARMIELAGRHVDDSFIDVPPRAELRLTDGWRSLAVRFDEGFAAAQVYAPVDDDVVCLEPMTAPVDALVTGEGLSAVAPGQAFRAAFSIVLEPTAR